MYYRWPVKSGSCSRICNTALGLPGEHITQHTIYTRIEVSLGTSRDHTYARHSFNSFSLLPHCSDCQPSSSLDWLDWIFALATAFTGCLADYVLVHYTGYLVKHFIDHFHLMLRCRLMDCLRGIFKNTHSLRLHAHSNITIHSEKFNTLIQPFPWHATVSILRLL